MRQSEQDSRLAPAVLASLLLDAIRRNDRGGIRAIADLGRRPDAESPDAHAAERLDLVTAIAHEMDRGDARDVHLGLLQHLAAPLLRRS